MLSDYQKEVLDEMVQNRTLIYRNEQYNIPDGISFDEVKEAFINRYAKKLNDYLLEPFGKAILQRRDPRPAIETALESFAIQIESIFSQLYLTAPAKDIIRNQLLENLEDRYKDCIGQIKKK